MLQLFFTARLEGASWPSLAAHATLGRPVPVSGAGNPQ